MRLDVCATMRGLVPIPTWESSSSPPPARILVSCCCRHEAGELGESERWFYLGIVFSWVFMCPNLMIMAPLVSHANKAWDWWQFVLHFPATPVVLAFEAHVKQQGRAFCFHVRGMDSLYRDVF